MPTAISTRQPEVSVEYDCRNGRATKHFRNAVEARRFYIAKAKAEKRPKVVPTLVN